MKTGGRLGTAVLDLTPERPLPLSGFANRTQPFAGVHSRLKARFFAFEDAAGRAAMVVCADLLGWDRCFVPAARRILRDLFGRRAFGLVLNASHTHSAPGALSSALPSLGGLDGGYRDFLLRQLRRGFLEAWTAREEVCIRMGSATCREGIHRRQNRDGEIVMAPNPYGPTDDEVTVVEFRRPSGEPLGAWLHYTCHPTTKNDLLVSAEYCGAAASLLEVRLDGAPCGFLQGCCGDIRPHLATPDGARFRAGACADVEALGRRLSACAEQAWQRLGSAEPLTLRSHQRAVRLDYEKLPATAELEALREDASAPPFRREWAGQLLRRPALRRPFAVLWLTGLRVSSSAGLLGLSAEPSVDYGMFVRAKSRHRLLPLGYTNGLVGYVTTAEQLAEGGYESRRAYHYFGSPAPFAPDTETKVKFAIGEAISAIN